MTIEDDMKTVRDRLDAEGDAVSKATADLCLTLHLLRCGHGKSAIKQVLNIGENKFREARQYGRFNGML